MLNKKLCFIASSGGHFEQLLMLKPLMDRYNSFVVTEKTAYKVAVKGQRVYFLEQVNRKEISFMIRMIKNTLMSFKIFKKEKPDVVISLGVLSTIPMCVICKMFGKKLIYIESFAKVNSATLTGKFIYHFADQFYVQWEPMLKIYPKAIYLGGIY